MLNSVNKLEIVTVLLMIYHPIDPYTDVFIKVLSEETDPVPKFVALE